MTTDITEDEYWGEVEEQAETLAKWAIEDVERDTAYEEPENAVLELVSDVLDAHNWFARSHHGPADHGAIIEYGEESDADLHRYGDIEAHTDSDDATEVVKRLAYASFEAHVIEEAKHRVNDHDA